jgi:uracil-DNA glycosylase family 4
MQLMPRGRRVSLTLLLAELTATITECRRCNRLVEWREKVAGEKRASFRDEEYWGRPVPGFGDPEARVLILGLAPAAHGGNRTGRIFTGDRSGDFLFAGLHRAGFANQPTSETRDDGLTLTDCYVAACVRCAPPANKPTLEERDTCLSFLIEEFALLPKIQIIVALGAFAWDGSLQVLKQLGHEPEQKKKPQFGHLHEATIGPYQLLGCYHPSQQNTFTGKLTTESFDKVWQRVRQLLDDSC